jgi:acetyltransferase-like isoleucine patch superfamily enzyme
MNIIDILIARLADLLFYMKRSYYKRRLHVKKLDIYFPIFISDTNNLTIGENCSIAPFVQIWANDKIYIGENTAIAAHVQITTSTHDYHHRPYRNKRIDMPITIGKNVWIGGGAIILPGVIIGDNAVIGAGSVVTKNIPENTLAYGVPAKIIKQLPLEGNN